MSIVTVFFGLRLFIISASQPKEKFDDFLEAWRFGVFWGSEGTLEKGSWGSKSIGYQAFYRFKCVFGGPTQPISQIASAQIPLFIGFGASAPIGFLKQGAQLQDHIH